jgi:uncharacterized membrane protein (DUF485 family)
MTETVPDNPKKRRQFIWTSTMNLVFLIILAIYTRSLQQLSTSPMPAGSELAQLLYVIAPPAFGLVGLLLALAWKPLSRGIIVLLTLHYILMLSLVLLIGYADIMLLVTLFSPTSVDALILFALLAVLIFLILRNVKSLKDLDLPSIFGKR